MNAGTLEHRKPLETLSFFFIVPSVPSKNKDNKERIKNAKNTLKTLKNAYMPTDVQFGWVNVEQHAWEVYEWKKINLK